MPIWHLKFWVASGTFLARFSGEKMPKKPCKVAVGH
jgi:hypothetical protein